MKIFIKFVLVCMLWIQFTEAVRILSLHVPSSYVLVENNTRPLILDCVYEFRPNDVGFVLKWYHNNYLIYQWIPPRMPYVFNNFKYHINTSFTINNEDKYKYRAIELKPHWNLTGDFMCSVQTYHTRDRKIKRLQMIVPETHFQLHHHNLDLFMENGDYLLVVCTVENIFPEPDLNIIAGNNNHKSIFTVDSEYDKNGFCNKSIMFKINKLFLQQPSTIDCQLSVNESNYIKKKQFIYYDHKFDKYSSNEKLSVSSRLLNSMPNHSNRKGGSNLLKWIVTLIVILEAIIYMKNV